MSKYRSGCRTVGDVLASDCDSFLRRPKGIGRLVSTRYLSALGEVENCFTATLGWFTASIMPGTSKARFASQPKVRFLVSAMSKLA